MLTSAVNPVVPPGVFFEVFRGNSHQTHSIAPLLFINSPNPLHDPLTSLSSTTPIHSPQTIDFPPKKPNNETARRIPLIHPTFPSLSLSLSPSL